MSAGQRIVLVLLSWVLAIVVYFVGATLLMHYDSLVPSAQATTILNRYKDQRSLWCIQLDNRLRPTSRWNPRTGPIPLSPEAAMTIAQRELAVIGIDPKLAAPTLHRIEDARTSERGDFYYYLIERRVVGEMVDGQFQPYAIAVLLDGTTIASKSVGCPEPGRGSNSDFATVRGFLIIFATTAAAFTFFLYTPIAVFLTRTARRRLIMFGAVVAILGAALGVGRTWLFPGVDEWLVLPPGIDYAPLLGVLPALAVIEMAIRLFHPVGAKGNGIGSDNDA